MSSKNTSGLKRGLSSLLGDIESVAEATGSNLCEISVDEITPNPDQPRKEFDGEEMQSLKESISRLGVIQAITVKEIGPHQYQLISGERRWRASKMAGKMTIPAYIVKVDDEISAEMALVENTHRADLNPIEVALSYKALIDKYNYSAEELSEKVGKNRSTVANFVRLLALPSKVQLGVKDKKITNGHARALLAIDNEEKQIELFDKIVKEDLSVRAIEALVKQYKSGEDGSKKPSDGANDTGGNLIPEEYVELVDKLKGAFSSNVGFKRNNKGKGNITIPFSSDDDLFRIMSIFDSIIH